MKDFKKLILPAAATAIAFGTSNCEDIGGKDKEENANDKLVGQWEITDADGDMEDLIDNDYDYIINLEFHLAGDAEFCMLSDDYKYCSIGEWEWTDTKHKQLEIAIESDDEDIEISLDIDSFEGDKITGEMTFSSDGYEYTGDVTLERVYSDKSAALKSTGIENTGLNSNKLKGLKSMFKK